MYCLEAVGKNYSMEMTLELVIGETDFFLPSIVTKLCGQAQANRFGDSLSFVTILARMMVLKPEQSGRARILRSPANVRSDTVRSESMEY